MMHRNRSKSESERKSLQDDLKKESEESFEVEKFLSLEDKEKIRNEEEKLLSDKTLEKSKDTLLSRLEYISTISLSELENNKRKEPVEVLTTSDMQILSVGEWVRIEREKKGLSQIQLSKIAKFSHDSIRQLELGNSKPKKKNAVSLANALGINTNYFLLRIKEEYKYNYIESYIKKLNDIFEEKILTDTKNGAKNIDFNTLGELTFFERKKHKLSLKELESITQIHYPTLIKIEKGLIKPSLKSTPILYNTLFNEYYALDYIQLLLKLYKKEIDFLLRDF